MHRLIAPLQRSIAPGWVLAADRMTKFLAGPSPWGIHYPDAARPKRSYGLESNGGLAAAAQLMLYPRAGEGGAFHLDASISWIAGAPGDPGVLPDFLDAVGREAKSAGATEIGMFSRNELGPGWFGVPESWEDIGKGFRGAGYATGDAWALLTADVAGIPAARRPGYTELTLDRFDRPDEAEHDTVVRIKGADAAECALWSPPALFSDAPDFAEWTTLEYLGVEEPFRRQGLGRWLLGEQAGWLRARGVRRIATWVEPGNIAMRGLLAAGGFRSEVTCHGFHKTLT